MSRKRRKPKIDWKKLATAWREWYRGVNDPKLQERVGVSNVAVGKAQENTENIEFIHGGNGQRARVIFYPVNEKTAMDVLVEALPRIFPKIRCEVLRDERPKTNQSLRPFVKSMGEARANNRESSAGAFEFLRAYDARLVEVAEAAERYQIEDPPIALTKLRLFGEVLSKLIAARHGLDNVQSESFEETLHRLRQLVPRQVADAFHALRKKGNNAVHHGGGTGSDARTALKLARQLALWFHLYPQAR